MRSVYLGLVFQEPLRILPKSARRLPLMGNRNLAGPPTRPRCPSHGRTIPRFSESEGPPGGDHRPRCRSRRLLTLDWTDFHESLGREIYEMEIRTPADFLIEQRKFSLI